MWETLMMQMDVLVALTVLAGAAKSVYSGTLGELKQYLEEIPQIQSKLACIESNQEDMSDRQDQMADAAVALAVAQSRPDRQVNPDEMYDDLHQNGTPRDYLSDAGHQAAYSSTPDDNSDA